MPVLDHVLLGKVNLGSVLMTEKMDSEDLGLLRKACQASSSEGAWLDVVLGVVKDRLGQRACDFGDVWKDVCHRWWRRFPRQLGSLIRGVLVVKVIHPW
jgi:hypothetical protein